MFKQIGYNFWTFLWIKTSQAKLQTKYKTCYTNCWATAIQLEMTSNAVLNNKGKENGRRVNTLMQMYTNTGVTEKKEADKGCIYNRSTGVVMWVKGLNAGTLQHARANQFQKRLV